jgi:hypothetical protein
VHPFDVIARVLAERLRGCAPSEELRAIVHAPGVDWQRVVSYASAQFVLPAFAAALRDLELTEALDQELCAFLDAVHAANQERNSELRDELAAAVGVLNRADIEPVLLKGALRLVDELYPDLGWRMLRDLDLLVPQAMLAEAIRAFGEADYEPCALYDEVRRKEGACQIDLHSELFSGSTQLRLLTAGNILNGARSLVLDHGRVRIPSVEDQLVHLIGHSLIRHRGHAMGKIGLRDLLEAAALVHWGHQSIDWPSVSARFAAAGYHRSLLAFLLALKEGAWCPVPMTGRIDTLTALQQYRIRLQARSATLGYLGSRAGWWAAECKSQVGERDAGQLRAIKNLKRLVAEHGAMRRMVQSFLDRKSHIVQVLTPLSCSSLHEHYLRLIGSCSGTLPIVS